MSIDEQAKTELERLKLRLRQDLEAYARHRGKRIRELGITEFEDFNLDEILAELGLNAED